MEERYSGEYKADRSFMKELKHLDPRLGCKFRRDLGKFAITWERAVGRPGEVIIVENDHGGFRQPDKRELLTLSEGDLHRTDMRSRLEKSENYMRDYREKQDKNVADDILDCTKDDAHQLRNAYRKSSGKAAPAFRQVIPKKKKMTSALSDNQIHISQNEKETL